MIHVERMRSSEVLAMKNFKLLAVLIIGAALVTGCKPSVMGEYVQKGKTSLRLFEESTGSLFDVRNGHMSFEVDASSINPLSQNLILRMKSDDQTYLIRIDKSKIASDGRFELNEADLEQPIRISGQLNERLEVKIYKGFSASDEPIGIFNTKLENEVLKSGEALKQAAL